MPKLATRNLVWMDKRRAQLAVILLLLAFSTVPSNVFIYGHGDHPSKLVESDAQSEQEHMRLWGSLKNFPGFTFERKPFPMLQFEEASISCPLDGVPEGFMCNTCLNIFMQAQQILSDQEILDQIIEYMNSSFCEPRMPGIHTECMDLVQTYIPEAFKMLQELFTPDMLCVDTKICLSISMSLLEKSIKCSICKVIAIVTLCYLNSNKAKTEILDNLHSTCSKLGRFRIQCDLVVDILAPTFFNEFGHLSPQQLCQKIRLCTAVSMDKKSHCAACEHVILEINANLKVPGVKERVMEVLLNGCTKLPNHAEKCKEIVTQYGPFVFGNMDLLFDADTLCRKIHACEASQDQILPMLLEKETIQRKWVH